MANTFGMGPSLVLSLATDVGLKTSQALDSAWVFGTSGKAVAFRFCAPESQSNGVLTLYAYVDGAVTGAPTYKAELRDSAPSGDDPDRPDAGVGALVTTADVTPTQNRWATFSFTGVTLTEGLYYWVVIYNSHATPASNYCAWVYRGALDMHGGFNTATFFGSQTMLGVYSADGFTTDGTQASNSTGACVIKTAAGTLMGNPYVVADSAHASNTNFRGNRITIPGSVIVSGAGIHNTGSSLSRVAIYNNGTLVVQSSDMDQVGDTRVGGTWFAPTMLIGGTTYDVVATISASSTIGTIYTMGETSANLPADVLACRPCSVGYVDAAAAADLGASLDTAKIFAMSILVEDIPAPDYPGVGNVTEDDTVNGVTGTYHEATAAEVQSGVQFGAGGTEYTGTYSPGGGRPEFRGGNL